MINKKIQPLFIIMNALARGYPIFPNCPDQIYKIFTPEELEEGDPGLYYCYRSNMGIPDGQWFLADHISLDKIIKIAYSLSEVDLVAMAANNALTEVINPTPKGGGLEMQVFKPE